MKSILAILAAFYILSGTMDYQDAVNAEQDMHGYADYYSQQDECFTDSCVGCTDDCLDGEV